MMLYIFIILLIILAVIISVKLTIKAKEVETLKKELDSAKNSPVHIIRESRPLKRLRAQVKIHNEEFVRYPDAKLQAIHCLAYEFEKSIEKGLLEGQIPVYEEKSFMDGSTVITSEIMIG